DPVVSLVKLIAEPWDVGEGGYHVGNFPPQWSEWNGKYRDTVRDYWRGADSKLGEFAYRFTGSSDLYAQSGRRPHASINFITAHDGFTLRDLVSYEHKHNEDNGEDNRDGTDNNRSQNCGVEGETDDPDVVSLRHRLAANLMSTLLFSAGVPMLTAGDERGRTQRGNNNSFCQDNETSWLDWRPDDAWLDLYGITRTALRIRRDHPALRQRHWFEGRPTVSGGPKDLAWIHPEGREMTGDDWHDDQLRVIGMFVSGSPLRSPGPRGEEQHDDSFLLWLNGTADPCPCTLPENDWVQSGVVVLSTDEELPVDTAVKAGETITLGARSLVLLQER
ncbi:MAG: glycogen debranching protein GlgX, partial [Marmoricola sp.]